MKVLVIANQKGGVGKTTLCGALGAALRERGRYVVLVDTDPQACLSLIAPNVEQATAGNLRHRLRRLAGQDYVIVDTPPAAGPTIRAAAQLADGVLVPLLPEFLALRGVSNLLELIGEDGILGYVVTAYRGHVRHHREALARIQKMGPVLGVIPFSIAASDAGLQGKPITEHRASRSRGLATAYRQLAEVVEEWANDGKQPKSQAVL